MGSAYKISDISQALRLCRMTEEIFPEFVCLILFQSSDHPRFRYALDVIVYVNSSLLKIVKFCYQYIVIYKPILMILEGMIPYVLA